MRVLLVVGWLLAAQLASATLAFAVETDVDKLLEFLIKEKVLTQEKATEFRADLAIKKQEEKQPAAVPDWVQNIKLKGDVRTRYEWDKNKNQQDNSRARIRVRIGVEAKVNNKLKAGIGISTGNTNDPRSRDITLGNSSTANTPGSPKGIILDYAYGQYTPFNWLTLTAGKFQNVLWQPFDALWDNDITPEGFGVNLSHKFNSKLDFFLNNLFYILKNDSRLDKQAFLEALQSGINWAVNGKVKLKSALTYYLFQGVKGAQKFSDSKSGTAPYASSGNTLVGGTYRYNYNSIQPTVELSFKDPFQGFLPYAAIFGDYIYNVSSVGNGAGGFDLGLKFGAEKVSDWKQWQGKLVYSKLGRDSRLDILTDNNRYGGNTNSQAIEGILEFGLGKNTTLVLDYYSSQSLTKASSTGYAPEQLFQADWNLKF
ncbi:MAG: putative porin [Candidatus Omnitrophica bacterium]|nr:putative porin [Candidatus Omnitrophota bacterium]